MLRKKWPTTKYWLLLLLVFNLLGSASSVIAEEAELYEQIYLTEAQALKKVMGNLKLSQHKLSLNAELRKRIQRKLRRKVSTEIPYFIGRNQGEAQRYAFILDEKGKHFPITFIVALNPDATVHQVAVMVYRERRGDGVKRLRFLNQFKGKGSRDSIEVNRDIVHLTGSTISSWSIAAGVRKAVVLLKEGVKP